jgi:two-component sensor histidine kinase
MIRAWFPADPRSADAARRWLRSTLPARFAVRLDDALLLGSELVTNAVLHGRSAVQISMSIHGGTARIGVGDDAAGGPVLRAACEGAVNGRGMQIVQSLADRWGVVRTGRAKTVWFELDLR